MDRISHGKRAAAAIEGGNRGIEMLGGIKASRVYIVCGYTDMRRSIDGLAAIVKQNYGMDEDGSNSCLSLLNHSRSCRENRPRDTSP